MPQLRVTDDLHVLLDVLPEAIADAVRRENRSKDLLEIVLDLGRRPEARFVDAEIELRDTEVTQAEIDAVVSRIGDFDADNRAGIVRTLHRISGIRNRRGHVVGLTCRVGRAVYGTIDIVEDIIRTGKSTLILGRPGVGKCVTGDTLILTATGLQPLADLIPDNLGEDQFEAIEAHVFGPNGLESASHAYNGGLAQTLRLTTRQGFSLEGTREHPVLALTENGELEFRRLDQLKPGDYLAIQRNSQCFGYETRLPSFEFTPRTNALDGRLPLELTEDLARFLGYLVAEGTLSFDNQVTFSNTDPEIQTDMAGLTESLFGLRLRRHLHEGHWNGKDFRIFGVKLRRFLANLGLAQGLAAGKRIPDCIFTAPKSIVTAFLSALFEGDGSIYGPVGRVEIVSASRELLSQLHPLLLNYGIVGNLRAKHNAKYDRYYYYLTIMGGENVARFAEQIGFLSTTKRAKLTRYVAELSDQTRNPNLDVVPYQTNRLRDLRARVGATSQTFYRFTKSDNRAPSYHTLRRILSEAEGVADDPAYQTLHHLLEASFFFDPVKRIEESEAYVYDLTVPGSHTFFANGFVSHNTTILREVARVLAEGKPSDQVPNRRVVVVDTSNEIGGDGDIPHPAVGRARRMQVTTPAHQHEVMIEAVENHNPEVIVIDEIGRELEAAAARTIAERGVQLIGTAHGNTLDNLLLNPTLSDLVGGIESVTLSDEEARRRGTQKTVLERRAPPTFDILVEIQERDRLTVHHDVAASVDALLRGRPLQAELRVRNANGQIHTEWVRLPGLSREQPRRGQEAAPPEPMPAPSELAMAPRDARGPFKPIRVYVYGVARNRVEETAARLNVPARLVDEVGQADVIITVKNYYRKRPRLITDAERRGTPLYVLRVNTTTQIENALVDIFGLPAEASDPYTVAMNETQEAIRKVRAGIRSIDLSPQASDVRRMQHEMVRQANLISHSYGREPYRRVRIYRE